jgi:hypothetical protein
MVITSSEIYSKLKSIFPDLPDMELDDREFVCVGNGWLRQFIKDYPPVIFIPGKFECEEIADKFGLDVTLADISDYESLPDELKNNNRAIGRLSGSMFKGVEEKNVLNFCIDEEKEVWLFDMQTREMWKPTENDHVFWAVMI